MHLGPILMSLISRSAPVSINAMMVSSYYLSIFVGGVTSGWLGKFYEVMTPAEFWMMHSFIVLAGAVLVFIFYKPLARILIK